ncbi:MAG: sialidase family protein [Planctomycetota bacterium]|nr:sialidase family protein [Planctomycetota bacterium]
MGLIGHAGESRRRPAVEFSVSLAAFLLTWHATLAHAENRQMVANPGLQSETFHGALVRTADGRLLNWWSAGKQGSQRAHGRYSDDEGASWTPERELFSFPSDRGNCGTGYVSIRDRSGGTHLFGLDYVGTGAAGFDDWENSKSFIYHVMSRDSGATWSRPQRCDFGFLYTGAVNAAIQTRSGRLLVPLSYYSRRKTGKFVSKLSISDDLGTTWRPSVGECVVDSGGHLLESGACEPICVELSDGRIWMLMRTQTGYQHEAFSADGGDRWSQPKPSRFVSSNSPGALLRMQSGDLVLVWSNCMSPTNEGQVLTSYDRQILAAAVSEDDGKTWQGYREIARITDALRAVSYPFLTEAKGESFFCLTAGEKIRVPIGWLKEKRVVERFESGLKQWVTLGCEGVDLVPHPDLPQAQSLRVRKPKADVPAGASFNFPFATRGQLTMRVKLRSEERRQNRQHCYFCLTDFFSLPRLPAFVPGGAPGGWGTFPEGGRFKFRIAPEGDISISSARGLFQDEFRQTGGKLVLDQWHYIKLQWDCGTGRCRLLLDDEELVVMKQLSRARGLCYLRTWMSAQAPEFAGLLIDRVEVGADR